MLWVNTSSDAAWQCCHISSWGFCAPRSCLHSLLCCYDVRQCSSPRGKQLMRCTHASAQRVHARPAMQGMQWGVGFNNGWRCCSYHMPLLQLKPRYEALREATPQPSAPWVCRTFVSSLRAAFQDDPQPGKPTPWSQLQPPSIRDAYKTIKAQKSNQNKVRDYFFNVRGKSISKVKGCKCWWHLLKCMDCRLSVQSERFASLFQHALFKQ